MLTAKPSSSEDWPVVSRIGVLQVRRFRQMTQGRALLPGPVVRSAVGVLLRQGERGGEQPRFLAGELQVGRAAARIPAPPLRGTRVIPGYTRDVKTAISVPDEIFVRAAAQAAELGISRSEFFARAARRYLDELAAQSLTVQIDQALQAAGDDDSGAAAAAAARRLLGAGDDHW